MTRRKAALITLLWTLALAAIALTASAALSQTRADLGATVSGSSGLGYTGPAVGVVGHVVGRGLENPNGQPARFGFEVEAGWLHAPKLQTHDGSQFEAAGLVRYHFTRLFIGFGGEASHAATSLYSKSGAGALGGVGWTDGISTMQAAFGYGFDENRQRTVTISGERAVRFSEHGYVSIRPFASFSRFIQPHPYDGIVRGFSGARAGVSVGVGHGFN